MIRFVFGLHLHQPVGNFDHVFRDHVNDVYRPFLQRLAERDFLPVVLHISGPLLEWLEQNASDYVDLVGRLAAEGKVELLLAGFYEPILVSIPRPDRVEQIEWMGEALRRRFGVRATGLWLTERVWEPELASDLAHAGVEYVLVDDRHFLVSGFRPDQLHAPWFTEADGGRVAVFPIDERLRYLIPFRPPSETVGYLRDLDRAGHRLAVLADDGEKFGGWPGTKAWVYERGWLNQFLDEMGAAVARGEVRLATLGEALREVPSGGLAYLPSASYREMEGWSLPPDAASRLHRLETELGEARIQRDGALVRGSHWRNFLVKYPESNRMHKKMQRLSARCREAGNPAAARRAIGRAQCNDAYWHGVFGGLYLPFLRSAIWQQLAAAERELFRNAPIGYEIADFDGDGRDEIWIHSGAVSAMVSPARGAAIEEFSLLERGLNLADVLTRRREAYHEQAVARGEAPQDHGDGAPSIHEIEQSVRLSALPPVDLDDRAMFVDRLLPGGLSAADYEAAAYQPVRSWARAPFSVQCTVAGSAVELVCRSEGGDGARLEKRIRVGAAGELSVSYRWEGLPGDALFAPEISLSQPIRLQLSPDAPVWKFPIKTVAKSERGLDETLQGESVTPRWSGHRGEARIDVAVP